MILDPIPLTPDPDEARRLLTEELSDPRYAEAEPTWFDRAALWVKNLFDTLLGGSTEGAGGAVVAVIIALVLVALIIVAVLVWGSPRLRRESMITDAILFDTEDERSSAELRRASVQAAAADNLDEAIALRLRAIARSLRERGAVTTGPSATVRVFAAQATRAFPSHAEALDHAASDFDDVRFLRRPGSRPMFEAMVALDSSLSSARPVVLAAWDDTATEAVV